MASSSQPSSSSSSSSSSFCVPTRGSTYDIFLSFRGEDTRNNFVDHLYAALRQKGIDTFKDDQMLCGGKPISNSLLKAIKESKFALVVFSKNYANSSWCLEELSEIRECHDQRGLKVIPIFYHVDPSDIRKQKGTFVFPLRWQIQEFLLRVCNCIPCLNCRSAHDGEKNEINKWREALKAAANISGHHILPDNGSEAATINKIVQQILGDNIMQPRGRETGLFGIESQMDRLNFLLRMEATDEVRFIGILGMGGIGKTTIARTLFKRIVSKFEGSSFVSNVRENSSGNKGICLLQNKILEDILGAHHGFSIQDPVSGAEMIQERLSNKKVLLVVDDVDDVMQLEFLAYEHDWFGPGSRIIITTRDQHMLSYARMVKYEPALLRMDQALELFSRHAFKENTPPDEFRELSYRAIGYTGGLPLALKVLGSFFCGRKANAWESGLDRLAKTPDDKIFNTLKISFDGLQEYEKNIFLDIACLFKGREVNDVTRVLDSFGFHAEIGITSLLEKSLITISEDRLDMHDLIQEMGLKVVHQSFPNSRLWKHEEIHDFIEGNKNLELVEAIVEDQYDHKPHRGFSDDVFKNMKNLRLLNVQGDFTCCEPTFLPHELRWLRWFGYPFSSLPVAQMRKLVGLELTCGDIKHLWKGPKNMKNLKFIVLHGMFQLSSFPNVSEAPNIEILKLLECWELVEVHESLGLLKRLVYLEMTNCVKLKCLPFRIEMESLKVLILSGCDFEILPEFSECMVNLSHIEVVFCHRLEKLPASIRNVSKLKILELGWCKSLNNIPDSICELKYLNTLHLSGLTKLQKLPNELGNIENLQDLNLAETGCFNFRTLPALCFLRKLDLRNNIIGDEDFLTNLGGFSSLEELDLSFSSELMQLPASISHLSRLKCLNLGYCKQLRRFNGLPSAIQILEADDCILLEKIKDPSEEYEWLSKIRFNGCKKLVQDKHNKRYLDKMLKQSFLKKWADRDGCLDIAIPGSKIPSWFKEQEVGNKIALKLPPKWPTQILGFAICGMFSWWESFTSPTMELTFENHGMSEPMSENRYFSTYELSDDVDKIVWIGYVPFSLLKEKIHYGSEGNIVIELFWTSTRHYKALRCGAHAVYQEDVESTQRIIKPSTSSYYWKWKVKHEHHKTIVSEFLEY